MKSKVELICIIDDDPIFVFGTQKLLQSRNFCNNFIIFSNGKDAIDNLKTYIASGQYLPEIILLDLNMPIMDGWQFLAEFTKIPTPKKITIYIVSSSSDPKDVEKAKTYKAVNNYVIKPISINKINTILEDF